MLLKKDPPPSHTATSAVSAVFLLRHRGCYSISLLSFIFPSDLVNLKEGIGSSFLNHQPSSVSHLNSIEVSWINWRACLSYLRRRLHLRRSRRRSDLRKEELVSLTISTTFSNPAAASILREPLRHRRWPTLPQLRFYPPSSSPP